MRFSRLSLVSVIAVACLHCVVSTSWAQIITEGDAQVGGDVVIAQQADGSVLIPAGELLQSGGIFIAGQPNLTGTLAIDGGTYEGGGNVLRIGDQGTGTLDIKNDGRLITTTGANLNVGLAPGSIGNVFLSGSGSRLEIPNGNINLGVNGTGNLLIEDGAQATSRAAGVAGGINFDNTNIDTARGTATIRGQGSRWNILQDFAVGTFGVGQLNISEGGVVQTGTQQFFPNVRVGDENSFGFVVVEGQGSEWLNLGPLDIGSSGSGSLVVRSEGSVTSGMARIAGSEDFFNINSSTSGLVTIDGTGSRWLVNGSLEVGRTGSASLHISNGGQVSSENTIIAGSFEGITTVGTPSGIVTIEGVGSRLDTRVLTIGQSGNAQVTVSNGGTLQNNTVFGEDTAIGSGQDAFGRLTIDGSNSRWIDNSEVININNGELLIQNGAVVSSPMTQVANGLVRITGTTSRWQVANVQLGDTQGNPDIVAQGIVEISDGATVQLAADPFEGNPFSDFQINPGSELVLNNGRLISNFIGAGNEVDVRNEGIVRGSGEIRAVFRNIGGSVRVSNDERLVLGASASNNGTIDITGGELDARSSFLNNPEGMMSLQNATLRVGESNVFNAAPSSANLGRIVIAGGVNRIFGNFDNTGTGNIVASSNSETTFFGDIFNEGVIRVSDGSVATFFGDLLGNGVEGGGTVFLEGNVSPGFSPGVMTFGGDVTLGQFSELNIEVADTAHDMLDIAGEATIEGDLILSALSALDGDTSLEIVSAANIEGVFDNVPEVGAALGFGVLFGGITYNPDSVVIDLLQQTADFNLDGTVDASDLNTLTDGYGNGVELVDGDADRDGDVDGGDFLRLQRALSATNNNVAAAAQAVPEPASLMLIGLALVGLSNCRRRHERC